MRKAIVIFVVLVAGICIWMVVRRPSHRLVLKTFIHNPQGLKPGALVRLRGVDVGYVGVVRASTEPREGPVEVALIIEGPFTVSIPSDATARLEVDGVLGPTFVEIDPTGAHGVPVAENGVLKSVEVSASNEGAARALEVMGNAMLKEAQKIRDQNQPEWPTKSTRP